MWFIDRERYWYSLQLIKCRCVLKIEKNSTKPIPLPIYGTSSIVEAHLKHEFIGLKKTKKTLLFEEQLYKPLCLKAQVGSSEVFFDSKLKT